MAKAIPTANEVSKALAALVEFFPPANAKLAASLTARVSAGLSKDVRTVSGLFYSVAGSLNAFARDNAGAIEKDENGAVVEFYHLVFSTVAQYARYIEAQVPEVEAVEVEAETAPAPRPRATRTAKAAPAKPKAGTIAEAIDRKTLEALEKKLLELLAGN